MSGRLWLWATQIETQVFDDVLTMLRIAVAAFVDEEGDKATHRFLDSLVDDAPPASGRGDESRTR